MPQLGAKIPKSGCLGRKCPNWGENPEIRVFRSIIPQLERTSRNWGVQVNNAPFRVKSRDLDVFVENAPIGGENPEIGVFMSKMPQLGQKFRNWGV